MYLGVFIQLQQIALPLRLGLLLSLCGISLLLQVSNVSVAFLIAYCSGVP